MSYLYCFPSGLLFYFFFPSLIKLISVHNNYDAAIYTWRDRLTFTTTQFVSRCRWLIEEYVCTLPTCFNFFAVLWMSLSSVTASKIFNFVLYAILFMPTTSRSTCTIIGLWSAGHTLALEFSDLSDVVSRTKPYLESSLHCWKCCFPMTRCARLSSIGLSVIISYEGGKGSYTSVLLSEHLF